MTLQDAIQTALTPLAGVDDTRAAVDFIGDAELALLGESSHGTHEFYASRANITKRLVLESGFRGVVVEADWPDAYRVNRYVRHEGRDQSAVEALDDFKRFPTWMWRNVDVVSFVEWLREHNDGLPEDERVGFYGMDLYALHASMRAVLAYLQKRDPEAARRARERYACFDRYEDPQAYAYGETFGLESCEQAVVEVLADLLRRSSESEGHVALARDQRFCAEQNARLVKNAEEYYRTILIGYTTAHGIVTAASDWDEPVEMNRVRPALAESYEHLFHEAGRPRFFLPLHDEPAWEALMKPRLERAIGVIYRPETERQSHYFQASLSSQFDAVLHFDHTSAVRPLDITAGWTLPEVSETYPTGV